jgi:gamma-glutamylcyclotransferase (GGCT)/AIG2-like uncharacterized protein YtfP
VIDYFAYGSNMSPIQMLEERCPGSVPIGIGILRNHKFIINRNGVATIVPAEGKKVIGVLWSITAEHGAVLDGYEGVKGGLYTRHFMGIEQEDGEEIEALVYIAAESEPGNPREGYLEKILYGAEYFGLPEKYIEELRSWSNP